MFVYVLGKFLSFLKGQHGINKRTYVVHCHVSILSSRGAKTFIYIFVICFLFFFCLHFIFEGTDFNFLSRFDLFSISSSVDWEIRTSTYVLSDSERSFLALKGGDNIILRTYDAPRSLFVRPSVPFPFLFLPLKVAEYYLRSVWMKANNECCCCCWLLNSSVYVGYFLAFSIPRTVTILAQDRSHLSV